MNKKILLAFFLLSSFLTQAQNLVPNPSFEEYVDCPVSLNQMDRATGWASKRETPDYFNVCNDTIFVSGNQSIVGVPRNRAGFQHARTGNAYAGFISHAYFSSSFRECVGIKLKQPLIIGKKYLVSFFTCRASDSTSYVNGATNKIGVRFSTIDFSYANPVPIDNYCHVFTNSVITDTLNWVEISGEIIADSAYEYLTIGNFFEYSMTTFLPIGANPSFTMYYVDDVSLMLVDTIAGIINYDKKLESINVFPNPASEFLSIDGADINSVSLYDIYGTKILDIQNCDSPFIQVKFESLKPGMYILKIHSNQEYCSKRIIIH